MKSHRGRFPGNRCVGLSLLALCLGLLGGRASADVVVYTHAPNASGGQYKSSWYAPDGLDSDEYVWDAFTLASSTAITQVQWRGAYTNYLSGAGRAPVYNFTVAFYGSTAGNTQPNVAGGPLVQYIVGGNAGETPAGSAGGVAMYDYHFVLPSPFQATGGVKYWIQIEAWQGLTPQYYWPPDWSIARGTGGDNSHFRKIGGTGGNYTFITGDAAFTLLTSSAPTATISATVAPAGAGTVSGTGAYPIGSVATLTATAVHGYGFQRWTENGNQVSTNPTYSFTVSADRTLVANFLPAYSVATNSLPVYGGTTAGGGTFNAGSTATVTATPAHGFVFSQWTEFGTPVSSQATYSFSPDRDVTLTAEFVHAPNTTTFDFDNAPVHTSLPVYLVSRGLGATFSGTGSGYSIQAVGELGIAPPGFSGLCLYPNSVFSADLIVDFSATITDFSILYAPQELGCDDSATMRVTAFLGGTQVGTNTATAPVPGTWPSGTLTIAVPSGFNRAVVHYDSRPPTCQDYGVIFLADNVTVTMMCTGAAVTGQPGSATICPAGSAAFTIAAAGTGPISLQWQIEDAAAPTGWSNIVEGNNVLAGGRTFAATGSQAATLTLSHAIGDDIIRLGRATGVRCMASNACGSATSEVATLILCPPDANCDGQLTPADVAAFVNTWLASLQGGTVAGDFDGNGAVQPADVAAFVTAWVDALSAGC
jgi:hypothetical protein